MQIRTNALRNILNANSRPLLLESTSKKAASSPFTSTIMSSYTKRHFPHYPHYYFKQKELRWREGQTRPLITTWLQYSVIMFDTLSAISYEEFEQSSYICPLLSWYFYWWNIYFLTFKRHVTDLSIDQILSIIPLEHLCSFLSRLHIYRFIKPRG